MTIFRDISFNFGFGFRPAAVAVGLMSLVVVFAACGGALSNSSDVVFSADADGNVNIFRMGSDLGNPIRITSAVGRDFAPAWSPNKEQIAFLSDRNGAAALWVMDALGESKRQVTRAGAEVSAFRWSPDSSRIGVEIVEGGSRFIEVLDTETGDSGDLTSRSEDVRIGDWSPDGEWIVYSAVAGEDGGIRRRNPTGVDEIVLTIGADSAPRWSRNGQWIAFTREADDGSLNLVVTDKDGGTDTVVATGVSGASPHDWSPDSKRLVYVSESSGNAEIYSVKSDGDDVVQLTSNRVIDAAPQWSRDGSSILFLSEGDGSYDVYSMGKSGEQQVRKTTISDLIIEADW